MSTMDEFMQSYRRKQGVPDEAVSEDELIRAEDELFQAMSQRSGQTPAECRAIFKEELGKLPPRPRISEAEADRLFIESMEKIKAANRALPKKRFSWAGLFALLAVAAGVMWLVYLAVEGF